MKPAFRSYPGILLALLLVLTGQGMAVARGMPDAAGTIVMCTGTGPMVVSVDASGQPVGPEHVCPDLAMALFAFAELAPPVPERPVSGMHTLSLPEHIAAVSLDAPQASARGPPLRG